jgi:GTPase SAR1 family protein
MSRKRVSTGEALFKVIMVGDSGTGKSCLLSRYVKDYFTSEYHVTLGISSPPQVSPLSRRS